MVSLGPNVLTQPLMIFVKWTLWEKTLGEILIQGFPLKNAFQNVDFKILTILFWLECDISMILFSSLLYMIEPVWIHSDMNSPDGEHKIRDANGIHQSK